MIIKSPTSSIDLNAQNLRHIKQRKGLGCIQAYSDDGDDQDDQDDNFITPYALQDFRPQV